MSPWLRPLLNGMLGMTALTLLVLALLPALAKRYRQRTLYGLLIICLLGFLIPWRPLVTPRPAMTVTLPDEAARRLRPRRTVNGRVLPCFRSNRRRRYLRHSISN